MVIGDCATVQISAQGRQISRSSCRPAAENGHIFSPRNHQNVGFAWPQTMKYHKFNGIWMFIPKTIWVDYRFSLKSSARHWDGWPLVNIHIAIENGHRNSGFPHEKLWIFHSYVNVYHRVAQSNSHPRIDGSSSLPATQPWMFCWSRNGAWNGRDNSEPLMTMLGKSNKCTWRSAPKCRTKLQFIADTIHVSNWGLNHLESWLLFETK